MKKTTEMTVIFDNDLRGDSRFILEQDENGLLYETSNAATRELVCSQMFASWPGNSPDRDSLIPFFGGREEIADRYIKAALDEDKS